MPAGKDVMKLKEAALQIPEFIVSEDSESKFYAEYFMRMIQEIENSDAENLKRKKNPEKPKS